MKHTLYLALIAVAAMACNKITVDFTYTPTAPKAGESITFTNTSSAGENWQWDFGDNSKSTLKNPTKYYKKPGTYIISLVADSIKSRSCTHTVTVYDSIPTFVSSQDSIYHMTDDTLTANIYNPFSYTLSYQWQLPSNCVLVSGELTDNQIVVYFTTYDTLSTVHLTITQGTKVFDIDRSFPIYQSLSRAIVFSTEQNIIWRQRLFAQRVERAQVSISPRNIYLIANAQDTMVEFNSRTFYASQMKTAVGIPANHIAIDEMEQKWYLTNDSGLYVCSLQGAYPVQIDSAATGALCVDRQLNLLYWAAKDGLYAMPLVKSPYNRFSTIPVRYNIVPTIRKITMNPDFE